MKTATAYIVYNPLIVSLSMLEVAGSSTQKKSNLDGSFDPDRSIFPLVYKPVLKIKDPDGIIGESDQTENLIDCRWYIGSNEQGERIISTTNGMTLLSNGRLQISRNIEPTNPLSLFFVCRFIDPRTKNVFTKKWLKVLSTDATTEQNLSLEIDAAHLMPVSPFKNFGERDITATFRNGETAISDAQAVYKWKVLDGSESSGYAFRDITTDDLFYISGQSTKTITIDRRLIDKEVIRLEAYHVNNPSNIASAQTTIIRRYGQWDEREVITRGKFYHSRADSIEVTCYIDSEKGAIASPQKFFDITHIVTTNEEGSEEKTIAYGESFITDASIASSDPHVRTVFGVSVKERTALRPIAIEGNIVTIGGLVACLQIPK